MSYKDTTASPIAVMVRLGRWIRAGLALRPQVMILIRSLSLVVFVVGCGGGRPSSSGQWVLLQQDLQQERVEIGRQRDQLETDRREWDKRERRDSLLASAVSSSVLLICCALPLLLVLLLFWPSNQPSSAELASEVLVTELLLPQQQSGAFEINGDSSDDSPDDRDPPRLTDGSS